MFIHNNNFFLPKKKNSVVQNLVMLYFLFVAPPGMIRELVLKSVSADNVTGEWKPPDGLIEKIRYYTVTIKVRFSMMIWLMDGFMKNGLR